MQELFKLTGPALARLVGYLVPLALVTLFAALAAMGFGAWDPVKQELVITVSVAEITAVAVALVSTGSLLPITALLKGWKSRKGDIPVAEAMLEKPLSAPTVPKIVDKDKV